MKSRAVVGNSERCFSPEKRTRADASLDEPSSSCKRKRTAAKANHDKMQYYNSSPYMRLAEVFYSVTQTDVPFPDTDKEEYVKARAERRSSNGLLGLLTGVASSFALNTGYYCFSLIHKNGERPLNLIAPNKALFDLWLFGLRSIIEELAKEKEEKQRPQQQPSSEPTEARDNNDEQADEVLVGVSANNSADNNKIENKIKNENGNVNKSMSRGLHHLAPRPELKHQYDTLESLNEASQDEHLSDDDDSCA